MSSTLNSLSPFQTIAPADTAAVAEMVREAAGEGRAVYPRGGGTTWCYGVKPALNGRPGVVLSLEKMNRLVDHAAEDMTVTVEAGMTFAELEKILAAKNQRLPIDVREPEKATLGGLVALNQAGPRQFAYGTLRDYLIGFTAVDGEGTIFHGGGRVVKNAAGYNMTRLMTGSLGTLGILTQLTFMVRPVPAFSAIAICDMPDLETAKKLLADLNQSQVRPVAVELVLGGTALSAKLLLTFEGTLAESQWMLKTLQDQWDNVDGLSFKAVTEEVAVTLREELAEFMADARIAVRPSQVVELVAAIREKYSDCYIQSHAMSGIVLVESGWGKAEGASYYRELRSLVESFDGKMTVLAYPDSVELSREDIWGSPPEGFSIMRSLKERFDPQNILNPGRFIFE